MSEAAAVTTENKVKGISPGVLTQARSALDQMLSKLVEGMGVIELEADFDPQCPSPSPPKHRITYERDELLILRDSSTEVTIDDDRVRIPPAVEMGKKKPRVRAKKYHGKPGGRAREHKPEAKEVKPEAEELKPEAKELNPEGEEVKPQAKEKKVKPGSKEHMDELIFEDCRKQARAIMNKVTDSNFKQLMPNFVRIIGFLSKDQFRDSEEKMLIIIRLIFDKAVREPRYSHLYARLVLYSTIGAQDLEGIFRAKFIDQCQVGFAEGLCPKQTLEMLGKDLLSKAAKGIVITDYQAEVDYARAEFLNRRLGYVKFVGELFKLTLVCAKTIVSMMKVLLKDKDDTSVRCVCAILRQVGQTVEAQLRKHDQKPMAQKAESSAWIPAPDAFLQIICRIGAFTKEGGLSKRTRYELLDTLELRANGWRPRLHPKLRDEINELGQNAMVKKLGLGLLQEPEYEGIDFTQQQEKPGRILAFLRDLEIASERGRGGKPKRKLKK